MTPFETVFLAHLLGDWVLQTEWQALGKQDDWQALWSHVLIYHCIVLSALWVHYGFSNPRIYVAIVPLALSHAFLDRRWPVIRLMRMLRVIRKRDPEFWLVLTVDQSLHLVFLAMAITYIASGAGAP